MLEKFSKTKSIYKKLETDGYKMTNLTYPATLGDGLSNFMLFTINETEGSKYAQPKTKALGESVIKNTPTIEQNKLATRNLIETLGIPRKTTRKTNAAIALYMPEGISNSYSTKWEQGDFSASQALAHTIEKGKDVWNQGTVDNMLATQDAKGVSGLLQRAGDAVQSGVMDEDLANVVSLLEREYRNPYIEFLFKGINARTFSFTFKFFPRSKDESDNVKEIIKTFRKHSAPSFSHNNGSGIFYQYPSEFDIQFCNAGTLNENLFKISSCALTNIDVDYTPAGSYTTFVDGSNVATVMILTFTELEMISRERIEEGF